MKDTPKRNPRFIAKVYNPSEKRKSAQVWRVYDRERGSWPVENPLFGKVAMTVTEGEALEEAARLEGLVK